MAQFSKAVVSDDLEYVLKSTNSEIKFSISSNGSGYAGVYGSAGQVLADEKDVEKLGAINSFVTGERRAAEKETVDINAKKMFVALTTVSYKDSQLITMEEKSIGEFKALYKPLEGLIRVLSENVKDINLASYNGLDMLVARYITNINTRIRESVANFLTERFRGEKTNMKLNDFLFEAGVPTQVFHRLTSAKVDWSKSGPQALLFPKDPSKGFSLSVKEIRDVLFCEKQVGMLTGACLAIKFFRDDQSFKIFANVPDEDFVTDRDGNIPFLVKYGNKPVLIPIPRLELGTFVEALRKGGPTGYAWPRGRTMSSGDLITFMGSWFKQVQFAGLPNMRIQHEILRALVPSWPGYDRSGTQRDPLIQFISWYDKLEKTETIESHLNGSTGEADAWNAEACTAAARSTLAIAGVLAEDTERFDYVLRLFGLNKAFEHNARTRPETPGAAVVPAIDKWGVIVNNFKKVNLDDEETSSFVATKLVGRKNRELTSNSSFTARSLLGVYGTELKKKLGSRKNLSIRVEDYLRGFFSVEVQDAVAKLLLARFDSLFTAAAVPTQKDLVGIFDVPLDEGSYDAPVDETEEELGEDPPE